MASDPEYMRRYRAARQLRYRSWAIEQLGGQCVDCGGVEALEFDHLDRDTKLAAMSLIFTRWSHKRIVEELKKCVLRCRACHSDRTSRQFGVGHGGGLTGKRNCKCAPCKARKAEYMAAFHKNRKSRPR